ncbi:hypothetical protein DAPPUDRAFT_260943 [Daphnia pulex]|uniref:Uncharacterized protein n=1 Tax=Daphnia pulex TaxID=6669 RepID=E9HK60_DAPPU|nr:hypothetical protein DAPPUDRAFT_260943 [Daphnia pulex]|eukprot:EFX67889.1 hypothetical protein DAPPUDRAFT_260943 [Daphnia pulex]
MRLRLHRSFEEGYVTVSQLMFELCLKLPYGVAVEYADAVFCLSVVTWFEEYLNKTEFSLLF